MNDERRPQARKAVVLLSGGLDSSVTAAWARREGFEIHALTIHYGQRHACEVDRAYGVARLLGAAEHRVVRLDPSIFLGSALVGGSSVPQDRSDEAMAREIPATYVPARNTVFLALALAYAEGIGAFDVFIGANAVDYSGYPDCRPEYIRAFTALANLATKAAITGAGRFEIHAPLMAMTKAQIVALAGELGVDPARTWSCYQPLPSGRPCGRCDSCLIRRRAFAQLGRTDPLAAGPSAD